MYNPTMDSLASRQQLIKTVAIKSIEKNYFSQKGKKIMHCKVKWSPIYEFYAFDIIDFIC